MDLHNSMTGESRVGCYLCQTCEVSLSAISRLERVSPVRNATWLHLLLSSGPTWSFLGPSKRLALKSAWYLINQMSSSSAELSHDLWRETDEFLIKCTSVQCELWLARRLDYGSCLRSRKIADNISLSDRIYNWIIFVRRHPRVSSSEISIPPLPSWPGVRCE